MTRYLIPAVLFLVFMSGPAHASGKLNVLLITVDDMNWDSLGVTGCKVANISPNIDRLASEGMLFQRAHVTIAVCQPTRAVLMTGRYPIRNGARGFEPINKGVPTLIELLRAAGFRLGIIGKVPHVVPSRGANWHMAVRANELKMGRDPDGYYRKARQFFDQAKNAGSPFFLMANAHDPHRPFAGSAQEKGGKGKRKAKSPYPAVKNAYRPDQVTVPKFLPDLPAVRLEMSEYYTSVRRADATVGAVLRALADAGLAENTIVVFLSDHGMPLPFAKTNCYYHSTRTPWIVRWPGKVRPGSVDRDHFISCIDFMPTVLDALKLEAPDGMDGRSFLPLLHGGKQERRDSLLTVFHKTSGRQFFEMRALHDGDYLYIFNPWSDGKTVFRNESQAGRTMKAMSSAAAADEKIAQRVKLFLYRVPEELYNTREDPDCLHNLIGDANHKKRVVDMRRKLLDRLQQLDDYAAKSLRKLVQ